MTRLVEDDVVEKLVVGMVFLMTGASFCNNVAEEEMTSLKKIDLEKKYNKAGLKLKFGYVMGYVIQ